MAEEARRPLTPTRASAVPSRAGLAAGLVLGVPVMLVGVLGLAHHTDATPPADYLRLFVGGDLLHDLVVAPLAALVGVVVLRRLPATWRGPLRAALFGTAIVIAVAWPALRAYGRDRTPDNPSVQPLHYATSVATAIGVVWVIAAVWLGVALVRDHRARGRAADATNAQPVPRLRP
jgi:hypothetical protein